MNNLIKIESYSINGEMIPAVSARELHAYLGNKAQFSHWIKDRIEQYGFLESIDFITRENSLELESKGYTPSKKEYFITVDMAKELSMVERTDNGKIARKYFIECEKELGAKQIPALPDFNNPVIAARAWADAKESEQAALVQLEAARPAVEFVERYVEAKSSKCLSDVAKLLKHKPQAFFKLLSDNEVIFKRSGSWIPYQKHIDKGRFTVTTGEGNGHAYQQTRVEPDGIVWLAKMFPA
jgi:anti-repressor protein